jgi:hypothetical protein
MRIVTTAYPSPARGPDGPLAHINEKARENRLRRIAERHGYRLTKSRSRDPQACDYGLYGVLDVRTNGAVNPALANRWVHSWTLDHVEEWLTSES